MLFVLRSWPYGYFGYLPLPLQVSTSPLSTFPRLHVFTSPHVVQTGVRFFFFLQDENSCLWHSLKPLGITSVTKKRSAFECKGDLLLIRTLPCCGDGFRPSNHISYHIRYHQSRYIPAHDCVFSINLIKNVISSYY